jgi:threonine synthase
MVRSLAIGQRSLGDGTTLYPLSPVLTAGCPATSGAEMQYPLEIAFDYSRLDLSLFDQPPLPDLSRWAPLLPPLPDGLSLGEGGTPLVETALPGLPFPIFLKDESRNPTWSHKDRLNYCAIGAAKLSGVRGVVVASTGNHGAASAAYAARAGLRCIVVTSAAAQPAFLPMFAALGADIVCVDTDRRWPVLRRIADATGYMPTSNVTPFHTSNAFGPEGYKTIAYELFLQFGRDVPGTVVVPTGYGELLFGLAKGFRELRALGLTKRVPRLVSAEPAVRGPLARAIVGNAAAVSVEGPPSIAAGIACTVSGYRGVLALRESEGLALTASEASLHAAREKLGRLGFWQEASGTAGIAALCEASERGLDFETPVVAILTSTGLKDVQATTGDLVITDEAGVEDLIARHQ